MRLFEAAKPRRDILADLHDKGEEVLKCLIVQYALPSVDAVTNRWKKETYELLPYTFKWTKTNRFLSSSTMYQEMFGSIEGTFLERFNAIAKVALMRKVEDISKLEELVKSLDKDKVLHFCQDYFLWLAESFSVEGEVTLSEVIDKIEGLLFRYR